MKKHTLHILSAVCVLAIVAMIFALSMERDTVMGEFIAPDFDETAITGTPEVENSSYSEVYMDGMDFSTVVCALFTVEDSQAEVFFTNPETNEAWLKLRIENENGDIIAETGMLTPGQYVQYITFTEEVTTGDTIKLVVMAYEPETYMSLGSVGLNTTLK